MKLARIYDESPSGLHGTFGIVHEEIVFLVQAAVQNLAAPHALELRQEMLNLMVNRLDLLPEFFARATTAFSATEITEWTRAVDDTDFLPPVFARSFRDFYAFEAHVANARRNRGKEMLPEWYESPVFYFSNTASIIGPDFAVKKPPNTNELDYELEIALIIGREGSNIPVMEADSYIAGFTILNDWSARDLQRREMKVGLGPAKGKDFATSLGPYWVTPDELEENVLPDKSRGKRYDLEMFARVNGEKISHGNTSTIHWTFAELIAEASRNTTLNPGDIIGSGTVGTGCLLEFPSGSYSWLEHGDEVELEIDKLGILRSVIL